MKIGMDEYKDKVYGAWVGKSAGGIIGAKQENNKSLMNYTFDNVFPDRVPPNDDFDLQILYLNEVLLKKGFNFTANDLADAFCKHNKCWANEYRIAIKNIDCGIYPPTSGEFCNDFFKNSNGCPIRSEIWSVVAPGNPALACGFCEMDGCIDHSHESVYAEKFNAALDSISFFERDIEKLLIRALAFVEPKSKVSECVLFVLDKYKSGVDWKSTREELIRRFGSSDASYSVVNMGIVTISLLY